ncbi:response regulator [Verrucomicrobium sp. BvORR034]|uniref:response regulator n=1 Tax=Verrucomicrobium sp. BvORR034 TaxID=1396418 RepID=UPI0006789324|nr:response regulator [Verrucomicrobium sp. BvORR034]
MAEHRSHIVLVEDSASQALKLISLLEAEGWLVTWVSTAEEAFITLRDKRPDLVLLDYYLPGMRGDEVCRRIRMHVDSRSLPIVILTAQEDKELQGLDSGADDFILKSGNPEYLLLRVRTLLQKSRPEGRIFAGGDNGFRTARLLAIDDSVTFLEHLRGELEGEGYKVDIALDPLKSLELVRKNKYDGVIIDLLMPNMDGFEVCRRINELRHQLEVPLITIVLTGAESRDNLFRALEAGADDFVGKSGDYAILKGRIRALLRRKFYEEENSRILHEFRSRELEAARERVAKEAAEARAAFVEELQQREEELRNSREELKRANEAKDQFLAVLSHELRTPLSPVLAVVAEWCDRPEVPEELRRDLEMVKRNIDLEARLIDDLLDLTRIIKGKMEMRDDEVDLRELLSHAIEICRESRTEPDRIVTHDTATQTRVRGDAMRLTQVLWNLLRNAVKFTPEDGSVQVSLKPGPAGREGGNTMVIEVADSGIGIAAEDMDRIFNAFDQGNRAVTRQFGGLGLGLAISRAIVELHHGTLTAASAGRSKGATFTLTLPVFQGHSVADLVLPVCQPSSAPAVPAAKAAGLRILLVEDHEDTREVMRQLLQRRGHEVLVARSVATALALLDHGEPVDLLISDLGLPDGSGLDLIKSIRNRLPLRAIALSGYGMEEDHQRSREAGFQEHLVKPVNFPDLLRAIERLR